MGKSCLRATRTVYDTLMDGFVLELDAWNLGNFWKMAYDLVCRKGM